MKISLFGVCFALFITLCTAHSTEDYWRDTLWIRQMPLGGNIYGRVTFSPDGKSVFATSDQYMFEYDVMTGNLLKTRETKSGLKIIDYQISKNAEYFVVLTEYSGNINKLFVEVWHRDSGIVKSIERSAPPVTSLETFSISISSDMVYAYIGYIYYGLEKISLITGTTEYLNKEAGGSIDISPDQKVLISKKGSRTSLVNTEDLSFKKILPFSIGRVQYSPDGNYIAGLSDKDIILYDIKNNSVHYLQGHKGDLRDVCFTADGKYVVSVASNEPADNLYKNGYRVWDVTSKQQIFEAPYVTGGYSIAISTNKDLLAAQPGNMIRLWKFKGIVNSINDDNIVTILSAIPNPTSNSLKISYPFSLEKNELSFIDIHGNTIFSREVLESEKRQGNLFVELASYPSGTYFVTLLVNGKEKITTSFIIHR